MAKKVQKKERLIVYFVPTGKDKKVQFNQFHTEASSQAEARATFAQHAKFEHKLMGIGVWEKPLGPNIKATFVNNKFY